MRDVELLVREFVFPDGKVIVKPAGAMFAYVIVRGDAEMMGEHCYVNVMAARANGYLKLKELAEEERDDG